MVILPPLAPSGGSATRIHNALPAVGGSGEPAVMTKLDISRPTIAELLDTFAHDFLLNAKVRSRKRFPLIRAHLTRYLETDADNILTRHDLEILRAERELDPINAFARTMHADDLFYAMHDYFESAHALGPIEDRRAQLDIAAHLCQWLWDRHYVSEHTVDECAVLDVQFALRHARERFRAEVRGV